MKKRYLQLSTGRVFEGIAAGAAADGLGELVFNTSMVGYIETLTDPSYAGQIILQTFPLIGNYGMISADYESPHCFARGYVAREFCDRPSNFRSEGDVDSWLKARNVPAIVGVDTREITRILREEGVMNAAIVDEVTPDVLERLKTYRVKNAVEEVSARKTEAYPAEGEEKYRLALIDYGVKKQAVAELNKRGARVTVLPYDTSAETILSSDAQGVVLSNGPGDPKDNEALIGEIQKLMGKLPVFGICLGHQMMALAAGGQTVKLKYGHRGANQPVKRLGDKRVFITSQNHGYAVSSERLPAGAVETYQNANDFTNEGLYYPDLCALSVQFHPEACGGPKEAGFLFDQFLGMLKSGGGFRAAE